MIRCIAISLVIFVHFFSYVGFYDIVLKTPIHYAITCLNTFARMCVPLFLLLTGALMREKVYSRSYFFRIFKILFVYLFSTIIILIFRMTYLKENLSFGDCIKEIYSFSHYAWYLEMYIGLYMIIPALNIIYHHFKEVKEKKILIIISLFITTIPSLFDFLPNWWGTMYPISYFFLGAFIFEYISCLSVSFKRLILLFLLTLIIGAGYCFIRSYQSTYVWGAWNDWGGIIVLAESTLFFSLLLKADFSKMPKILGKSIRVISELSFGMYIISWATDKYINGYLNTYVSDILSRIPYFILTVPMGLIMTAIISLFVNLAYDVLVHVIRKR